MCLPQLWDGTIEVVPDALFCQVHKRGAVAWLFGRLRLCLKRKDGMAQVKEAAK